MAAARRFPGPDVRVRSGARLRPERIVRPAIGTVLPLSLAAGAAVVDRIPAASALSRRHPAAAHRVDRRSSMRKSGTHRRSCRRWSSAHAMDIRRSWRLPKVSGQLEYRTPGEPLRRYDGSLTEMRAALRLEQSHPPADRIGHPAFPAPAPGDRLNADDHHQ